MFYLTIRVKRTKFSPHSREQPKHNDNPKVGHKGGKSSEEDGTYKTVSNGFVTAQIVGQESPQVGSNCNAHKGHAIEKSLSKGVQF